MTKYYFTYGRDDESRASKGGWTEVEAADRELAYAAFKAFHPKNEDGFLPFCECYSEEEFAASGMNGEKGNCGKHCHERICITRELTGGNGQ